MVSWLRLYETNRVFFFHRLISGCVLNLGLLEIVQLLHFGMCRTEGEKQTEWP